VTSPAEPTTLVVSAAAVREWRVFWWSRRRSGPARFCGRRSRAP